MMMKERKRRCIKIEERNSGRGFEYYGYLE